MKHYENHTATKMIPQAVTTTIAEVPDNTPAAEQLAQWLDSVASCRDRHCFELLFDQSSAVLRTLSIWRLA